MMASSAAEQQTWDSGVARNRVGRRQFYTGTSNGPAFSAWREHISTTAWLRSTDPLADSRCVYHEIETEMIDGVATLLLGRLQTRELPNISFRTSFFCVTLQTVCESSAIVWSAALLFNRQFVIRTYQKLNFWYQ